MKEREAVVNEGPDGSNHDLQHKFARISVIVIQPAKEIQSCDIVLLDFRKERELIMIKSVSNADDEVVYSAGW